MIYFTAHTFKCVCHCRRAMFRVLGMYNFASTPRLLDLCSCTSFFPKIPPSTFIPTSTFSDLATFAPLHVYSNLHVYYRDESNKNKEIFHTLHHSIEIQYINSLNAKIKHFNAVKKFIYNFMWDNLTFYWNRRCFSMIPKHWLDNIVQI